MTSVSLFGPVPSRRLGLSLGIDLTPAKVCSFNCLYCECGKTVRLTLERAEYVPTQQVIAELDDYLRDAPPLDSITFAGSGEPTLHTGIGEIIDHLKKAHPGYRVTVLTNSSLLSDANVRRELMNADLVIPSLDAVSDKVFRVINRPVRSLDPTTLIEGLRAFCAEFRGQIWLEIFIVPAINDSDEEIARFAEVLKLLRVDRIQLNTLDRPGAVSWIEAASIERLEDIARRLGTNAEVVIARPRTLHSPAVQPQMYQTILSTILVRPCTIDDLEQVTGLRRTDLFTYIDELIADELIVPRKTARGTFYLGRSGRHIVDD